MISFARPDSVQCTSMSTRHTHPAQRTIHHRHHGWDHSLAPAVRIAPAETLEFDVARLDFSKINPVNGPVFIEDAQPGDILKVTLLSFAHSGWGWTANIPGFGLLADEFKEAALHAWRYDART